MILYLLFGSLFFSLGNTWETFQMASYIQFYVYLASSLVMEMEIVSFLF